MDAPDPDAAALDAYSRAVVSVVERAGPAVVAVRARHGGGSGFVIAPDGYLVTNSHVVRGVREPRVALADGTELPARLVGDDPPTDLAVLRVGSGGLPWLAVGSAVRLRPGQLVVAVGHPLGFESTVSTGVLSATDRTLPGGDRPLLQLLQHTAPLNPGSSGGPLLASDGTLIGVNTAIIPAAAGLGFAVPIQTLSWVVPRLMHHGAVVRGYLGVAGQTAPVPPPLAARHGCAPTAVRIEGVEPRSPAARAAIERGDLLVRLDEQAVDSVAALHRRMADATPGRSVRADVLRRGAKLSLTVVPARA